MKCMYKYKVMEDLDLGNDPATRKPIRYSKDDVVEIDKILLHTNPFKRALADGLLVLTDAELAQSELAPEMMEAPTEEVMEKPESPEEPAEVVEEVQPSETPVEVAEATVEEPTDEVAPDLRRGIS